ncbi:hypothetical protein ABPG75_002543 [Micractinium tetrahymenae]
MSSGYDPAMADQRREQERPRKALSVGKLTDLSTADLGASKTVAVAVDPVNAPMEDLPPLGTGGAEAGAGQTEGKP